MKVISQDYEIMKLDQDVLLFIEKCGRTCYKSEKNITPNSAGTMVKMLVKSGHHSVLEHSSITVRFILDRAVSHEFVRHRLASYSQESQRYINYKKGIQFILPLWLPLFHVGEYKTNQQIYDSCDASCKTNNEKNIAVTWLKGMLDSEKKYSDLIGFGLKPELARTVLPNSTKTEIVVTANLREWRHIFNLRCSLKAYPQIRYLMLDLLEEISDRIPIIFDDLYMKYLSIKQ